MDPSTARLHLASRLHFALLRHLGEDVGVSTLLRGGEGAREALWVCIAADDAELADLGRQFAKLLDDEARQRRRALRAAAAAPQDAAWAQDTSGFGVSRPADAPAGAVPPARSGGWFAAAVGWRKRSGPRSPR